MYEGRPPRVKKPTNSLLQPLDVRLPKEAQQVFIPFVNERDATGKLLWRTLLTDEPFRPHPPAITTPRHSKPNAVFFRTADTTSPKLKRARYVSPPIGFYDVGQRPLTIQKKRLNTAAVIQHSQQMSRARSTDFLNIDEVFRRVDKHVSVVDMARVTARARAQVMTEEEKWLLAPKFELPEHLRKYKGFYDVSGLDTHRIEDPTTLFAPATSMKGTIKSKMKEINATKKNLDAKLFR